MFGRDYRISRQDFGAESGEGGFHQPGLGVRRVHQNDIERAIGGSSVYEVAHSISLVDDAALRDAGPGEVVADATNGGLIPLHEHSPGRAARQGLYATAARTGEQVQDSSPGQVRSQDRE